MTESPEESSKKTVAQADEILNDYVQLDIHKRFLKRELDEVQEQLTAKTEMVLRHMERMAISKITIDGITLSPKTSLYPKDDKDRTVTRWRLHGRTTHGDVIDEIIIDQMWETKPRAQLALTALVPSRFDRKGCIPLRITEITLRASVAAMLANEDTAWLVGSSYNPSTLKAWIKELPKDEKTQMPIMPDHLKGLIDVSEVFTVASRKA